MSLPKRWRRGVVDRPVTGATGGGGSGDVSGPSSAVNDNFASFNGTTGKIIKDSGVSAASFAVTARGLPAGGAKYSRLAKNSTTNYDVGWYGPDWFNIADYGAIPNVPSSNYGPLISAVCTAALAFAVANNTCATVYIPDGVWYISSEIQAIFLNNARLTIRGNGRHSSVIVIRTPNQNALVATLSGGTPKRNRITIQDLGFSCESGLYGNSAIVIDYGSSFIGSSENIGGSVVRGIDIYNDHEVDAVGGYTYGITMKNAWHFTIDDVFGYGNAYTWTTASSPGAGDGQAGSGAMLNLLACFNFTVNNVQGTFWSQFIRLGSAGLAGEIATQGSLFNLVNCVSCTEFIHSYIVNGTGLDWITLTNWQCDNSGAPQAANVTIYLEGGGNGAISNGGSFLGGVGTAHVIHNACSGIMYSGIHMEGSPTHAVHMMSTSNVNSFNGCEFGSAPIEMDLLAGLSQFNNTGASTITNAGSGNRFLSTLF